MRIFLIGFMGAGKTTHGKKLASKLKYSFTDLDQYIEQKHRMPVAEIFEKHGEETFRLWERDALNDLTRREDMVIALGGGTPCFYDNMEVINRHGESVYIKMSVKALTNRLINAKAQRPIIAGKSTDELERFLSDLLHKRKAYYEKAKHIVEGHNLDLNDIIKKLPS